MIKRVTDRGRKGVAEQVEAQVPARPWRRVVRKRKRQGSASEMEAEAQATEDT